jgi:excisionase family DNA binding protein
MNKKGWAIIDARAWDFSESSVAETMSEFNKQLFGCIDAVVRAMAGASSLKSEWFNSVEAADFLGVPVGTLRNMTSNGKVIYFKLGRCNRYRKSDLQELLLSKKRGASNGN